MLMIAEPAVEISIPTRPPHFSESTPLRMKLKPYVMAPAMPTMP